TCGRFSPRKWISSLAWRNAAIPFRLNFSASCTLIIHPQHACILQAHLVLETDPNFRLLLYWKRVQFEAEKLGVLRFKVCSASPCVDRHGSPPFVGAPEDAAYASSGVTVCLTGNLGVVQACNCALLPGNIASERLAELPVAETDARCGHGSYEGVLIEELRRRKHPQHRSGRTLTLREDLAHICHVVYRRGHAAPRSRG